MCCCCCRTEPRCQYWLFRAGQDDPNKNGCAVKLAANNYAPDSYTALKLGTGDYTIWQVGVWVGVSLKARAAACAHTRTS